jgi:hypothetical protein
MASVGFERIEPLTDATLGEIVAIRRVTVQPMRDTWPGINQPFQTGDEDGD